MITVHLRNIEEDGHRGNWNDVAENASSMKLENGSSLPIDTYKTYTLEKLTSESAENGSSVKLDSSSLLPIDSHQSKSILLKDFFN